MRLRIDKAELLRVLERWHARRGEALPALVDVLAARGLDAFAAEYAIAERRNLAELERDIEQAGDTQ
jgi:hypothetical protein